MEQITESIFPEKQIVYASFWSRFVACFVDCFFVFMSWFLVSSLLGRGALAGVINLIILLLYGPLMEASPRQASLGKTGMRIKVVDMEGNRISYAQAFGRHIGKLLSAVIVFIGYFMMLGNSQRQTLHDRMAGTLVIAE